MHAYKGLSTRKCARSGVQKRHAIATAGWRGAALVRTCVARRRPWTAPGEHCFMRAGDRCGRLLGIFGPVKRLLDVLIPEPAERRRHSSRASLPR